MIYFLYGHMVKKIFKTLWKTLTILNSIWSLLWNVIEILLTSLTSMWSITKSVYIKPTDRHQYLHYRSSHPGHIKGSNVYSQTLWASHLCSFKEDFVDHYEEIKTWFSKQSYTDEIENEMKKVNLGKKIKKFR